MPSLKWRICAPYLVLLCLACAGDPGPPPPRPAPLLAPREGLLRLCGTGAMTPLMERLAEAWRARPEAARLHLSLEDSIGSAGGVRAAAEGVIDIGLVSLPLHAEERALGLTTFKVAVDAVVLAAHRGVPVSGIGAEELRALYSGASRHFADGSRAVVLLRDEGESANTALEQVVPGLRQARLEAQRRKLWRVLYHDSAMAGALASTPSAIGVFSLGALLTFRLPLKLLALDGVMPSLEALEQGRWKARRELVMVLRPERVARARPFLDFVLSPEGRRLARESGYLPSGQPSPAEGAAP